MEGIEACVENVDDTVMPDLSSQLITMIKKAVGLPTKVGDLCSTEILGCVGLFDERPFF
jgi:hypothetical protein